MKKISKYTVWLRYGLLIFVAVAAALVAYAATADDLNPIDSSIDLVYTETITEIKNDFSDGDKHFLFTGKEGKGFAFGDGPYDFPDGMTYRGQNINDRQITFKIKDGLKATIKIYAYGNNNSARVLYLRKDTNDGEILASTTGAKSEIITSDITGGTYVITGADGARFCGLKITVEKSDPTLATVTDNYQWRVQEGDVLNPGVNNLADAAANTYFTYYTGGTPVDATLPPNNGPVIDGHRAWDYDLSGNSVGIQLGEGKGTITIYAGGNNYYNNVLKKGDYIDGAVTVSASCDNNGVNVDGVWCSTKIYTYTFDNSKPEVYWITLNGGILAGIDIEFEETSGPAAPKFATISDDFSWICTSGVDVVPGNNTPVNVDGQQKYYTYYNNTAPATVTDAASVLLHGGPSMSYNLDGRKLGFKVAAGKYVIDFFTSADATAKLYFGDENATGNDSFYDSRFGYTPEVSTVTIGGVEGKTTRYVIESAEETVYWLKVDNGTFAGFDVMFDISSPEAAGMVATLPSTDGSAVTWTPTKTDLRYATGLGVIDTYTSGAGTYFYHLGQTVVLGGEYPGCVPLGEGRAIGFRNAAGRELSITVATKGSGDYKVVSGHNPLDGAVVVTSSSVATDDHLTFSVTSLDEETFWVTGEKTVYVESITYTVKSSPNNGPLRLINTYYLWRAGDEAIPAQSYFDGNSLRYNNIPETGQLTPDSGNKISVLGVPTPTVMFDGDDEFVIHLGGATKGRVTVYYTGADNISMQTSSADETTYSTNSTNEIKDDYITYSNEDDVTRIKSYNFDLTDKRPTQGRLVIIGAGSTARIAAVEVVQDRNISMNAYGSKNIDWYVCGDAKMIVGSERVEGNTEYAEFYVSKGRVPRVSFFMPSVLKLFYQGKDGNPDEKYKVSVKIGKDNPQNLTMPKLYNSSGEKIDTSTGDIWIWMTRDWEVKPNSDNTQTITITATDPDPANTGSTRTWKAVLTFHYLDCPVITVSPEDPSNSTAATLTMTAADGYDGVPIFYTIDSTDPVNKDNTYEVPVGSCEGYYSTNKYSGSVDVSVNCIALAAQYVETPRPFYTDGPGSATSSLFKLLSRQKYITLADRHDITYVKEPINDEQGRFNREAGDIEVLEVNDKPVMRLMYGKGKGNWDEAVKFFRIIDDDNTFQLGAVNWSSTGKAQDSGYDTYMDPYQWTLAGSDPDKLEKGGTYPNDVKFNANPDTEMNGGIGGAYTEDGGMFLQPVAGDFFRLEPEYDGIATVWVRQNGMVDYGNMYDGQITRRPVYVLDEDGVIQRGSTIKPTALHHLSVNGVYATASGRNELRSSFANTWKYATSFDEGWNILHGSIKRADSYFPYNFEMMQIWFGDILKFKTNGTDNYIIKSGDPQSAPIEIDRANSVNINRYSRIGTQLLYRDDWMAAREAELGAKYPYADVNPFAKYGYEIPNFGYVKYFIPVKAGKSYYMGGRGTKNGFVALQFEPLPPNYDNKAYQREDNPNIVDNGTTGRATLDWNVQEPAVKLTYSAKEAVDAYDDGRVKTMTISEDGENYDWWTWWVPGAEDENREPFIYDRGNMLVGTTINVDLVRNFEAGKWYPIVLPFSVSESRMREMFGDDVKVLYLDPKVNSFSADQGRQYNSVYRPALDVDDTNLKFTNHHYQMLYANTPAFICPSEITDNPKLKGKTADDKTVFHFKRVCFAGGEIKTYDIGGGYEVTGSYYPTAKVKGFEKTEMYYISNVKVNGKDQVVMYHSKDGIDMKGTRCWIRPKKGVAHAPIMTMGFGSFSDGYGDNPGMTGITDVISDDAPATLYDNDNVYDIMGRIVAKGSTAGLPSGVYIFKGKKVYVK